MVKYDYDKLEADFSDELDKCMLTEEQAFEVTQVGAPIIVKSIEGRMRWKKNYSKKRLKIVTGKGIGGVTSIGWNNYWGRMLENGTIYMQAQPHLRPGVEAALEEALDAMTKKTAEIINR